MAAKIKIHVKDDDLDKSEKKTSKTTGVKKAVKKTAVKKTVAAKKKVSPASKQKNPKKTSKLKEEKTKELDNNKGLLKEKVVEEIENDDFQEIINRKSVVSSVIENDSKFEVNEEVNKDVHIDGAIDNSVDINSETLEEPKSSISEEVEMDDIVHEKGGFVKNVIALDENLAVSPEEEVHNHRSVNLYKRIAYSFIALTVLLVAVIFYFSSVKVTIVLIPNQERVNSSMIFDVYDYEKDMNPSKGSLKGVVREVSISDYDTYSATGEEVIGKEAVGKVNIINNHNRSQQLVATTRLLPVSDTDKLFRIDSTVIVPAGGSVEVDIYADQPGPEMAIGPTKFTIPGLWAGLQEKIYAESDEKVVYRQKVKKYVVQTDIDDSVRDLKNKLLISAKDEIDKKYSDYGQVIYKVDENSIDSVVNVEVGDEDDDFTSSIEADVIVVAFDDDVSAQLAKQKFESSLESNKEMLSFDSENIIYTLNNYDHLQGVATINATFEGKISLKQDFDIIDKKKILGLNRNQLNAYLTSLEDVAGYEVKFYPPFINKIPRIMEESKINVEIKK